LIFFLAGLIPLQKAREALNDLLGLILL
jgi:hypothetical protein